MRFQSDAKSRAAETPDKDFCYKSSLLKSLKPSDNQSLSLKNQL